MNDPILVTGAAGFIGHHVLAELLRRGATCSAGVRPPLEDSQRRLLDLLAAAGLTAEGLLSCGRLQVVELNLPDGLKCLERGAWSQIVHCAGSTVFQRQGRDEPRRTNLEGTRALLDLAQRRGCRSFHLLSTAYVAGRRTALDEQPAVSHQADAFNNVYEESKFLAESAGLAWAAQGAGTATIFRPAICAGHSRSGRTTSYLGFYRLARATQLLADSLSPGADRRAVALRIRARPQQHQNIVPVDHVAAVMSAVVLDPAWHGRIYHLTHPDPPTNAQVKEWLEQYFDIGGGRFVDPGTELGLLSPAERAFYDLAAPIVPYFFSAPAFSRRHTAQVEAATGLNCPPLDGALLRRWIDAAIAARWGRAAECAPVNRTACAVYFEKFLPQHVPCSRIAGMTRLTTSAAFTIGGREGYRCVCRFEEGRLAQVSAGVNGGAEFGYRASYPGFLEAITGRRHPQELFFEHAAQIEGDVERGLKMAMILHEFTREFPCDEARLKDLA